MKEMSCYPTSFVALIWYPFDRKYMAINHVLACRLADLCHSTVTKSVSQSTKQLVRSKGVSKNVVYDSVSINSLPMRVAQAE